MRIKVTEVREYIVPDILAADIAAEIKAAKVSGEVATDYMEELLATLETREGAEQITTMAVEVVKERRQATGGAK